MIIMWSTCAGTSIVHHIYSSVFFCFFLFTADKLFLVSSGRQDAGAEVESENKVEEEIEVEEELQSAINSQEDVSS